MDVACAAPYPEATSRDEANEWNRAMPVLICTLIGMLRLGVEVFERLEGSRVFQAGRVCLDA